MAKVKKKKCIIAREVKIGLKKDGSPKKHYHKGKSVYLTDAEIKHYKQNNIIE
ncbi:hypothetical protein [Tenacibaculum phage JQ]|nr:hypothetical protein [Tenacibaculum phage JQ]